MKAKYKDLIIEGTADECYMFYIMSKFEKKLEKQLKEQFEIEQKATQKRNDFTVLKKRFKKEEE